MTTTIAPVRPATQTPDLAAQLLAERAPVRRPVGAPAPMTDWVSGVRRRATVALVLMGVPLGVALVVSVLRHVVG